MSTSIPVHTCKRDAKNCRSVVSAAYAELDLIREDLSEIGLQAQQEARLKASEFVDRHKSWGNQAAVVAVHAVFTDIAELQLAKSNPFLGVVCTGASVIRNRCTAYIE